MALVIHNPVNQNPHAGKSDQERHRGNEHAPPRPVGNRGADQKAQPRQLQQHQQHNDNQADKRKQIKAPLPGHTLLLNHPGRLSLKEFTTNLANTGTVSCVSLVTIPLYSAVHCLRR